MNSDARKRLAEASGGGGVGCLVCDEWERQYDLVMERLVALTAAAREREDRRADQAFLVGANWGRGEAARSVAARVEAVLDRYLPPGRMGREIRAALTPSDEASGGLSTTGGESNV